MPLSSLRQITTQLATRANAIDLTDEATRSERLTSKVRYAALALYLGDPSLVAPMLQLGPDPTERTAFTLRLKDWPADLSAVREVLKTTTDESLRSGVVAAIGRFPKETIAEFDALSSVLQELFVTAPDGGSHSASDWTLRQWGVPLPDLKSEISNLKSQISDFKSEQLRPDVQRWYTNSVGMTFVEIPAGKHQLVSLEYKENKTEENPYEVELTRPVYLSNRELTVAQFLAFASDPNTPANQKPQQWGPEWEQSRKGVSPENDCPMQTINWFDSVLYCNWLSRKEGSTPCYTTTGKKMKMKDVQNRDVEVDEWLCDFTANGYRLPTDAEWEVSCRAGTTTAWSCGQDDVELREFAVFNVNSRNRTSVSGTKLPNGWGLFDTHGNVYEWCHDWYGQTVPSGLEPQGPQSGSPRVLRGGSWLNPAESATSANRDGYTPDYRSGNYGIRLAQVPGAEKKKEKGAQE